MTNNFPTASQDASVSARVAGDAAAFSVMQLQLDPAEETRRIATHVREQVLHLLRRRGVVVGLSGGIDSSVTAALCSIALGPDRVQAVFMPESESDPESLRLGRKVVERFGIRSVLEDIGPILSASGCYERRDEFIRRVVPQFGPGWRCKLVLGGALKSTGYNITSLEVQSPEGQRQRLRLPLEVYLGIVAAANMKQRVRKQIEYYHADRLNYAVAGTPNRLEYDQGFFVKNGDGAADLKPIAHLYKSQVYRIADHLGVPEEICRRPPTTDTWSLAQSQEEFYFALPYQQMDLCLYGLNNGLAAEDVARAARLTIEEVALVWRDIAAKRRATRYLHRAPALVEEGIIGGEAK
jgi:NAD+ synthase